MMNVPEVARYLKVHPQTVYKLAKTGQLQLWSAEILRHSCSAGQETVFVVKAIQDGVSHNSA